MREFWILWQKESELPPRVMFSDAVGATEAARGMAQRFGTRFYVLRAESFAEPMTYSPPVKVEKLEDSKGRGRRKR